MTVVTIHNTIGALEVGVIVAVFLFGIVSLQMFYYVETFGADDRKTFRAMAAAVWLLELTHTICICIELYRGTVTLYGRIDLFVNYPYMGAATILSGFITWIVHIFFCLRVYKALPTPLRYIGPVCALATTLRTIGGVYLGTRIIAAETLKEYQAANGWLVSATLAGGAAIDVIIAVSMVHFLVSKKQTGLGHVAKLVDRLVAYAIRTGVLTSITAITVLVLFQTMGHNFVWAGFYVVLAKMYSNSFFSALNERERLRTAIASSSADADSRMLGKNRSAVDPTNFRRRAGPEISIEMKTTVIHDDEENLKHIPYDGRRL